MYNMYACMYVNMYVQFYETGECGCLFSLLMNGAGGKLFDSAYHSQLVT